MQRTIRLTAAALAVGVVTSACGFGGDTGEGDGGSTTLDLLVPSYSDHTKKLWEDLIADFEAQNSDINVQLQIESWDDINKVVSTKLQSDDAPDILNIDAFASFAADDLLYPAADVVSEETLNDFQPSFRENASLDGEMFGLPFIASARTLFYNKDLLKQAGYDEPPATWDELLETSKAVSNLGQGLHGYGMPLGNEEAQAETSIWTFGNGGSWGDQEEITVDTPENVEAVEFMQKMIEQGATQPDPGATDRTPLLNVFMQGKIGMVEGLPPIVGEIEAKNPDLNYGLAPIPTKDGSPVTLGVADHLMAFKNEGDKQEEITKFLDYFFSPEVYVNWVGTEGFLPTTQSGAEELSSKESLKPFLDLLPDAKFYPSTNDAWAKTQGAMQSQMGRIAQGDAPAEVLGDIQETADQAS